jgi:hypothetical protein
MEPPLKLRHCSGTASVASTAESGTFRLYLIPGTSVAGKQFALAFWVSSVLSARVRKLESQQLPAKGVSGNYLQVPRQSQKYVVLERLWDTSHR